MKMVILDPKKTRQAMGKSYEDIDKFFLKMTDREFILIGLRGRKVQYLGEVSSTTKIRAMIGKVPLGFNVNGYEIRNMCNPDLFMRKSNEWAVFRKNNSHPLVSNLHLDQAIEYAQRKRT